MVIIYFAHKIVFCVQLNMKQKLQFEATLFIFEMLYISNADYLSFKKL